MDIITKRHKDIKKNERTELAAYIKFEKKVVYFSAGAVKEFGLFAGLCINFVDDGQEWMFYCDESTDGFPLTARQSKQALIICSASLSALFCKRTLCSVPSKFPLTELKARHNGNPLIKIEINHPIEIPENDNQ